MFKILRLLLIGMFVVACSDNNYDPQMASYVNRHDMHWTSLECDFDADTPDRPSGWKGQNKKGYYSGALMGNGLLGTNLYKAEHNVYRLNVGRSDLTEQREGYDLFRKGRLPIGYFTLSTVGEVQDEKMELNLYDAVTTGVVTTDRGSINFTTYVHSQKDLIVFETEEAGEEPAFVWSFRPFKAISPRAFHPGIPDWYLNSRMMANPEPYSLDEGGIHFLVQPLARDTTFIRIARYYVVAWKDSVKNNKRRILATVSFEDTEEAAVEAARMVLDDATLESSGKLLSSHKGWWHKFYADAAQLCIPDPEFERFYVMQYYKFASTARPDKPIVDLQGVWPTFDTPWPSIWMNLNIQLTYSFQTKANMASMAQPLWDALWENRDNLSRNVTDIPGQEEWSDAAAIPRICYFDFHSPLEPSDAARNRYEAGNLAWTLFYWYRQCLSYGDTEQMRDKLFPLLKSAVNLFFHIRETKPDGTYSLPPTASPEYSNECIGPNSNYDLANLRQGLITLLTIDSLCAINDPMVPAWKDFLANMPDFQYSDETGFKVSETTEFLNTKHRHYSHLFMIYPYHMLDWNDPIQRQRANFSIDRWQGDQGYSRTGKAAMLASEGLGDEALEQMKIFLHDFIKPNTLYAESGPVIETPLAAVSTIHEFYMQDWGDRLRVFYGCPSEWKDASFKRMRAAGAFLLSAERKDGKTERIELLSEKGGECRIQTDIPSDILKLTDSKGVEVPFEIHETNELPDGGSLISFMTSSAEKYIITRQVKN